MTEPSDALRARFAAAVGGPLVLSRSDDRWVALGADVVAFAADDDAIWRRLEREAWLLDRWRGAGVPAPRVLRADVAHQIQVRERLHGEGAPGEVEPRLFGGPPPDARTRLADAPLSPFGERLATSYGELAARIRRAVAVEDARAAGFGLTGRRTLDLDHVIAFLRAAGAPESTVTAAECARPWLAALPPPDAVIHSDLHFFNLCLDEAGAITGVFDVGDAGIDAAATELLYVHSLGPRFVARAVDAYGTIDLDEVWRAHVRVALDHLPWNPPGTPRHRSIVAWIAAVLAR